MPFTFDEIEMLPGVVAITPRVFTDSRGQFMETYHKNAFSEGGIIDEFVQDNHSVSQKGTVRGIHFQNQPYAQAKLVRVTRGAAFDIAVDIRPDSPTYLQWYGVELTADNGKMLYIPKGFGHAFQALEDYTEVQYKCSAEYNPRAEGGIRWDDPSVGIEWPLSEVGQVQLSGRDASLPLSDEL